MDEILRDLYNPNNDGTNLARRLAAALAAFAAVLLLFGFLSCGATVVFVAWTARFGLTEGSRVMAASIMTLLSLGVPLSLYIILRRWRRKIDAGVSLWFTRWEPCSMAAVILALLVLQHLVPRAYPGPLLSFSPYTAWAWAGFVLFATGTLAYLAAGCFVWLWWCDPPPGNPRALDIAFWVWIAFQVVSFLVPSMELSVCLSSDVPPLSGVFNYWTFIERPLRDGSLTCFIRWETPGFIRLYAAVAIFGLFLFTGYMGLEAHRYFRR